MTQDERQRRMVCAYCGLEKPWTHPHFVRRPNAALMTTGGDGEFVSHIYAQCWSCWERQMLRSAMKWAERPWLFRIGRTWHG